MNGFDYPIAYFKLLTEIAERLKDESIQILTHEYHYETFGSWFFTFRVSGKNYQFVFDGKEFELRLEIATNQAAPISKYARTYIEDWSEIATSPLQNDRPTADQVIALILQAK